MVEFELTVPDMAAIKGHFGCLQSRYQDPNFLSIQTLSSCSPYKSVSQSDLSPQNSHPTVLQSQLKVAHPTQKVENEGTGVEVHNPQWGLKF